MVCGWNMTAEIWATAPLLQASIPFAVVGSNQQIEAKGKKVRGRLYPWGVVEVENPEHNDFLKLRIMLMWVVKFVSWQNCVHKVVSFWNCCNQTASACLWREYGGAWTPCKSVYCLTFPQSHRTHMQDLQEVTQDLHYENFRSERLKRGGRLSSHGYILPMSPAYVLPCLLAFLHLPLLKQQISELCVHLHPVKYCGKNTHTRGET